MLKAASSRDVQGAFSAHLAETHQHVARLEQMSVSFDERPRGKHGDGVAGILEEGRAVMDSDANGLAMDACLIAAAAALALPAAMAVLRDGVEEDVDGRQAARRARR